MVPEFIAHYRVTGKLGEGGMGEVYRATDTRLGREVAIKILPAQWAADADYLARFQREAQVLASLNHPNIAAIYGFENRAGFEDRAGFQDRAIVMELVEGQTLADRLLAGPVPIEEALPIAAQIAEALDAAHERGVIHRDLKPANIKITSAGVVKLLDFGLAKTVSDSSADLENSPTMSIGLSRSGVILGTAAYMSPEQARGIPLDRRADIWAFGAVCFEMLTGGRAFGGDTISDILAGVLKSEPDYALLPAGLSPRIVYLVRRCLRKKPAERLRDIGEARIWIGEVLLQPPEAVARPGAGRKWLPAAIALATGVLLSAIAWIALSGRAAPALTATFLGGPSHAQGPRISPDGNLLAFQALVDGVLQVAVMKPESGNWTVLTRERERGSVQEIAWSPDGTRLFFSRMMGSPKGIYSVPVLGGDERLVLEAAANPEMLADGSLLVLKVNPQRQFQIHHYWPESGKLEPLPAEVTIGDISLPVRAFPGGKEAAYFGRPLAGGQAGATGLYSLEMATGQSRRIAPGLEIPPVLEGHGFALAVTADGRSVLAALRRGDLRTVVAIPRTGNGAPQTLAAFTQDVWYLDSGPDGSLYFDQFLQRQEALRFPGTGGRPEHVIPAVANGPVLQQADGALLVLATFAGRIRAAMGRPGESLTPVSETREQAGELIAKIGERGIAFPLGPHGNQVIAIASLPDGRVIRRLPVEGGAIHSLASSLDGSKVYYVAGHGVWSIPSEGGKPERIADGDSVAAGASGLVVKVNAPDGYHLSLLPFSGGKAVPVPLSPQAALTDVTLSPAAVAADGRILVQVNQPHMWFYRMAVVDPNSGRLDVVPADYPGDIWYPGWTPDGRILAMGMEYHAGLWRMRPEARK